MDWAVILYVKFAAEHIHRILQPNKHRIRDTAFVFLEKGQ